MTYSMPGGSGQNELKGGVIAAFNSKFPIGCGTQLCLRLLKSLALRKVNIWLHCTPLLNKQDIMRNQLESPLPAPGRGLGEGSARYAFAAAGSGSLSGCQRRLGLRAASASSSRPTTVLCGASSTISG